MPTSKRKADELARDLKKAGKSKGQGTINFNKPSVSVESERSLDVNTTVADESSVTGEPGELCSEELLNETGNIENTDASMTDVGEISVDNIEQPNSSPEVQNDISDISVETDVIQFPKSASSDTVHDLIDKPFQPSDKEFPKTKGRSCHAYWFVSHKWLHYRAEDDSVLCYICHNEFIKGNLKTAKYLEKGFITDGFRNWKNALEKIRGHEASECHMIALGHVSKKRDIVEMNNSNASRLRYEGRKYLLKVLETLRFLARQGLALRNSNEFESNFTQALLLRCMEHPEMQRRIFSKNKGNPKYTHHEYQDEMLILMANEVQRQVLIDINSSPFFSIIGDECNDISNMEQLSFCVRWVHSKTFQAREEFMGFYNIINIKSDTIVAAIKDIFIRLQLEFSKLRGQTYDGASNMLGKKSGVATQIKKIQPKAMENHCHGHSLNLAVKDMTNSNKLLKNTLETVGEICILVKYSPKRESLLGDINDNLVLENENEVFDTKPPTIEKLCPTRWTVRASCYQKIIQNYEALNELWEVSLTEKCNIDVRARVNGCRWQMKQFSFFYGLLLSKKLYAITDNLSTCLQKKKMSAISGHEIARQSIKVLEKMRNDHDADSFLSYVKKVAEGYKCIEEPKLPRRRNNPNYRNMEYIDGVESTSDAFYHHDVIEYFRKIYFECIDTIVSAMKERFEGESYQHFLKLENVLLTAINSDVPSEEGLDILRTIYHDDINVDCLIDELQVLKVLVEDEYIVCFNDIVEQFKFHVKDTDMIPNVSLLIQLLLVIPATSASAERSFSLQRRLKTWLRSTMTQIRFNALSQLHEHKEKTDKVDLIKIGNQFISKCNERELHFGRFVPSDMNY